MNIITKNFIQKSIHLYPIGDIHVGDKCFGKESRRKLLGYINWIRITQNAYAVLMGDLVNGATHFYYWLRREGDEIKPPHKPYKK